MVVLARNSVSHLRKVQVLPTIQVACYSDHAPRKTVLPSSLKRGTGGRSSFNGIVATVFGSSGFIGPSVCNKLGKIGTQLILPYRCDYYAMRKLKLCGDLGQVLFREFDLRDEQAIYDSVKYSNVVINLIGRDWETKNFKFYDVHVTGARRLARIAREAGVEKFIHLSSLNVGEDIERAFLKNGSQFLHTKYESEKAVREEFPSAVIFRPASVYGSADRFLTHYASWIRRTVRLLPLWKKGEETIKQPVFVEDVAQGIVNAIRDRDSAGKTYQAVGPKRYYLSDLMDHCFHLMRKDAAWGYKRIDMRYDPVFWAKLMFLHNLAGQPFAFMTVDKIERECLSDKLEKSLPTLEDLDVKLTDFELQAPWELRPSRAYGYYQEEVGEYPDPPPLRVAYD